MYTHRRYSIRVRDGAGRYGADPLPAEEHPGAGALQDLRGAASHEIPLILARYAALRAWSLQFHSAPAVVTDHALSAAAAHLDATAEGWAENPLLREALLAPHEGAVLDLLISAAAAADGLGHVHGARALREVVHRARWRAGGYPPASPS